MGKIIDLEKKVIIVTGAGSGIGRETSRVLAEEGAVVIMLDISAEGLSETATTCGDNSHAFPIDLTESKSITAIVEEIVEKYGNLHLGFVQILPWSIRSKVSLNLFLHNAPDHPTFHISQLFPQQ